MCQTFYQYLVRVPVEILPESSLQAGLLPVCHQAGFTAFAKYSQKDKERPPDQRIGGKCPLELAGYEVEKLPIAQIYRGGLLGWPDETLGELVPNV
ncbi:MAG: hypothetical protein U9Q78_04400 [Chloroflexota bacterium]|nr:hypothetical protein [Chloroflexota bacterium]